MALSKAVTTDSIELAARSVDLTSSLINASNATSGVIQLLTQVSRWLERERLDENELISFFSKSRDCAWPNVNGEGYRNRILNSPHLKEIAPKLRLVQSGSLGRLLIKDSSLCWMVSTAACLFQCHNLDVTSQAITKMVMQKHISENQAKGEREERLRFAELQTKPIVRKIVESIMLNVVNSRNDVLPFPAEIGSLCGKGHNLGGDKFGVVTYTLQKHGPRVILRTKHLLRDLTYWLFYHFYGRLIITVCDKVIYDVRLGDLQKEVEMKISAACDSSDDSVGCSSNMGGDYEILEPFLDGLRTINTGNYPSRTELWPDPQARQTLYTFKSLFEHRPAEIGESGRTWARCTAQEMMKWLLGLSLTKAYGMTGFAVTLDEETPTNGSSFKISDLLKRAPRILDKQWGNCPPSTLVYPYPKSENEMEEVPLRNTASLVQRKRTLNDLAKYFPILQALILNVGNECGCIGCRIHHRTDRPIQEACQRYSAVFEVVMLLAHGIADAFGVDDVSARRDTDSLLNGIITLLVELVEDKEIVWDTWFSIAATVLLGCPYPKRIGSSGSTLCAIQYGNLTATADWLNLNQELKREGCFCLIPGEGKLSALEGEGTEAQARHIRENYAIVRCQPQENRARYRDLFPKVDEEVGGEIQLVDESSAVGLDMILISGDENQFTLLTQIRSESHRRIIDPSDILTGISRSFSQRSCNHTDSSKRRVISNGRIKLYDFDELLGRFGEEGEEEEGEEEEGEEEEGEKEEGEEEEGEEEEGEEEEGEEEEEGNGETLTFHITHFLDTTLKLNVACALTAHSLAFIGFDSCCPMCAIAEAQGTPWPSDLWSTRADRYIINTVAAVHERSSLVKRICSRLPRERYRLAQ